MKFGLTLLAVILAATLSTRARAQIIKPLDRSKQADVNDKTLNFGDAPLGSLSQPMADLPGSPLSKGDLKLQDVDQKKTDFKSLELSTVSTTTLPKGNFTTRRAEADVPSDETKKQSDQTKKDAPINKRQIKPFTPAGEQELKHQLNEPPLDAQTQH
jgi:hypothetical protein